MRLGLLKRIGVILLAFAFLGGGLPHMAMFSAAMASTAAASTAVLDQHAHHEHNIAAAASQSVADHDPSGKTIPACQHTNDCLACVALDLPARVRLFTALHWSRLTYQPDNFRLTGMTLRPELSPPIRQS